MTGQKSTTEHRTNQDVLNTTAGITVKGDESVLVASAGKNVELVGATLSALGKNGNVLLSAGENITLDTKKLQSQKDMTENAENYLRTKRGTELGTEIRADGNIAMSAGNDLKARAATIASTEGTTSLAAGRDITPSPQDAKLPKITTVIAIRQAASCRALGRRSASTMRRTRHAARWSQEKM